jgi:hypothetical protein
MNEIIVQMQHIIDDDDDLHDVLVREVDDEVDDVHNELHENDINE